MASTGEKESLKPELVKFLTYLSSQFSDKDLDWLKNDRKAILKRSVGPFTCVLGYFDRLSDHDMFITVVADDSTEETVLVGFWQWEPEEFAAHTIGPRFPELIDLIA